jgi:hypothetical protein
MNKRQRQRQKTHQQPRVFRKQKFKGQGDGNPGDGQVGGVDGYYILMANVRAHPMFNLVTERDKMH